MKAMTQIPASSPTSAWLPFIATTWHIEFRYGSDLDALKQYDAGEYAYWLASGISVITLRMMSATVLNFLYENLSSDKFSIRTKIPYRENDCFGMVFLVCI